MKASNIASPVAIALYLMLGCIITSLPFTAATVYCTGGSLHSDDPRASARDQVVDHLIKNTFYADYSQYCTYSEATGTSSYMYGLANCAMSWKCGPNFCATHYEHCSHCLKTARERLLKKCGDREAGFAEITDDQQLLCTMQFTNQQLCS